MKKVFVFFAMLMIVTLFFSGCKTEEKRELKGHKFENEYVEIEVGDNEDLTGSITIDMYIKLHDYPSGWGSIAHKLQSDAQNEFNLRIRGKDNGQWYFGDGRSAKVLDWKPEDVLPLNEWVRITAIRDIEKSELKLFINGELVANRSFTNLANAVKTNRNIFFLRHGKRTLTATLADVLLWKKALSIEEINKTSKVIKNPANQTDLIGYWRFEELEDNKVNDKSASNWDAVVKKTN